MSISIYCLLKDAIRVCRRRLPELYQRRFTRADRNVHVYIIMWNVRHKSPLRFTQCRRLGATNVYIVTSQGTSVNEWLRISYRLHLKFQYNYKELRRDKYTSIHWSRNSLYTTIIQWNNYITESSNTSYNPQHVVSLHHWTLERDRCIYARRLQRLKQNY